MSLLTDSLVRVEPALPTIGAAGGKIFDPVFGTTILRVSDVNDNATAVRSMYPSYPSINCDSTRVLGILNSSAGKIWNLNAANFTVSAGPTITNLPGNERYYSRWSGTNPDVIYNDNGSLAAAFLSFNVVTNTSTVLRDFTTDLPTNYKLSQLYTDHADNIFCASVMDASFVATGYLVWKRDTDEILMLDTAIASFNECYVDKSGQYFYYQVGCSNTVYRLFPTPTLIDTTTGIMEYCHNGPGRGTVFALRQSVNSLRTLENINSPSDLLAGFGAATQGTHHSFNMNDEGWGLVSRFHSTGGAVTAAFDNEIVLVRTVGSAVRRVCHHRAVNPPSYPRAAISPDSRFISFTSNWGGASGHNREDLFLVEVPPLQKFTICQGGA